MSWFAISYDFVKPTFARTLLARVIGGVGMVLAKGDEHKAINPDL